MYQVIIADDEAKIRSGLANLFPWNQLGFEIAAVCSNGKEALDFAMENPVDLVLSDIRMPIMDGLELSRLLLPKKPVKMVFFSGYQDFNYARQAMKNGVSDYLLKPVKYEDLSDCLTRIRETLDMEKGLAQPEEENLSYYEKIYQHCYQLSGSGIPNCQLRAGGPSGISKPQLSFSADERSLGS